MHFLSNNLQFNLNALIEAIDKISDYTDEFKDSDDFYHDQKSFDSSRTEINSLL